LLGDKYGRAVDVWSIGCIIGELSDGQPLFPGESEIDQLRVIQKILGPLPPDQMKRFSLHPNFRGLKFPREYRTATMTNGLQRKYSEIINSDILALMEAILKLDPDCRFTATQCLGHHAFNDRRTVRNHSQPPPLSRSESICSSGSSTPRQIPRDNLLSSLHNSINDLSYSVEPQQRGSIEKYREIKDKVQRSKPAQLPNGSSNTTPKQSFRFEKKPAAPIEKSKPARRSPSQQRRSKTSMEINPPSHHNFPLNPATSFTSTGIQQEKLTKLENYTKHNLSYSNQVPSRKKSTSRLENIQTSVYDLQPVLQRQDSNDDDDPYRQKNSQKLNKQKAPQSEIFSKMKIEKPELNRYMKEKKQTIHMNNNFINNSYATSQIRARQDVPPTNNQGGYKTLGQVQYSDNDNRGRSKTRNYIDYTKFQDQMYNKSYRVNQNQNNSKDRRLHNDEYKRYEKIYPEEWARPEYYHGNGPYKYY